MTVDQAQGFAHVALIVDTDHELTDVLLPELRRSLKTYDEVLVVVGARTRAALAGELPAGGDADLPAALIWGDTGGFYQRLGFAYESFRRHLADRHRAGRTVHVIAEPDLSGRVDPGIREERAAAYLSYEAICNQTYALGGSAVTCIWDTRHHSRDVIDGVRATHSHQLTRDGRSLSPRFVAPDRFLAGQQDRPMRPAPATADHEVTLDDVAGLSALRSVLGGWAGGHGFGPEATEDMLVAVVEVATNGLRHGGAPVRVRAWHHGDTLIVQCDDAGRQPVPPAAGFHRPHPIAAVAGGRGLWLARQLADVVTVSSAPGRTAVRLHFPRHLMEPDPR